PDAPHETLLVLDGTTGQNALTQARHFQEAVDVSGAVVTKLDSTAKGGMVFAIYQELKLPVHYIGVGEGIYDLLFFNPDQFVDGLFDSNGQG
ncbi:signal recognition particle-docking protein FtsY, partial [Chloroflexota bacterium]